MQTSKRLTIAIPTYNRALLAIDTVKQLQRQEGIDQCQVLIIDNASPEPVLDVMLSREPELVSSVQFHRNVTNIGLAGNLMRCMELAETEWLWILADDDDVADHAVASILERCTAGSDLDYILFSISPGDKGGGPTSSPYEFFQSVNSWSRLGFISTGVYRTKSAQAHLTAGMTYLYSLFPFIAIIIQGLESGKWQAALDDRILVNPAHKAVDKWALIASINGYVISELPKDPRVGRRLKELARGWCLAPVGLVYDFALRKKRGDRSLSRLAFNHKIFLISQVSWQLWLLAKVCWLISYGPPSLVLNLVGLIRRASGRSVERGRAGEEVFGQI